MPEAAQKVSIQVRVNGKLYSREVEPRLLLVEFIREDLELTGTHVGCDTTYCGACTVLMNGAAVKSCTVFAVQADGAEITTVEGLEKDGELHPIQKAFGDCYGLQCRADAFCAEAPEGQCEPEPEADSQSDCGKYLPVHRLSEHFQSDRNRCGEPEELQPWRLNLAETLKWRALRKKYTTS
jgi:hypothetical protein